MNRLYWLNDEGYWELVLESTNDKAIQFEAECRASTASRGVIGYAKYPSAPDYMRWTRYTRHEGGFSRAGRMASQIPKPIQLLEMFDENAGK